MDAAPGYILRTPTSLLKDCTAFTYSFTAVGESFAYITLEIPPWYSLVS
jgi:hypothetical protein